MVNTKLGSVFVAQHGDARIANTLRDAAQQSTQRPGGYAFCDSYVPRDLIPADVQIRQATGMIQCGDLDGLERNVIASLRAGTDLSLQAATAIAGHLACLTASLISAQNQETALVMLRTHPARSAFSPRWHQDGCYFLDNPEESKLLVTLSGNPTWVAAPSAEQRATLAALKSRPDIDALMEVVGHESAAGASQATLFVAGSHPRSCWHSEPPGARGRIFFQAIPGSLAALQELRSRFPTSTP